MKLNVKAILFTIGLYLAVFLAVFLTETFYVSRGANDITGPPFLVMVLGVFIILFFFIRSIVLAFTKDKSYWSVVLLNVILFLIPFGRLFFY